mgnify:CR=1 FL=1
MGLPFFGLTRENRIALFKQIHQIVFHGNGGYDYDTVYNMPNWLRNFTFDEIKKYYDNVNKQNKKKTLDNEIPKGPAIKKPDYVSKARK